LDDAGLLTAGVKVLPKELISATCGTNVGTGAKNQIMLIKLGKSLLAAPLASARIGKVPLKPSRPFSSINILKYIPISTD
jgi:hypothetical protein